MEESRKRCCAPDSSGDPDGKRVRAPGTSEASHEGDGDGDDDGGILAWLSVDEDTAGELMRLLEEEMASPTARVRFIDDPYTSPLIFQSSSSFVTINGNEETCGSSFSDWEASVMASVDTGGAAVVALPDCKMGQPAAEGYATAGGGYDGVEWDDDMLARFLGGGEDDSLF